MRVTEAVHQEIKAKLGQAACLPFSLRGFLLITLTLKSLSFALSLIGRFLLTSTHVDSVTTAFSGWFVPPRRLQCFLLTAIREAPVLGLILKPLFVPFLLRGLWLSLLKSFRLRLSLNRLSVLARSSVLRLSLLMPKWLLELTLPLLSPLPNASVRRMSPLPLLGLLPVPFFSDFSS